MGTLLAGKRAIVTGGGRGIGRAIAQTFARAGARVVIAARTNAQLEEVAAEISQQGGPVYPLTCDVSVDAEVKRMVDQAAAHLGGIDILVNNAGGSTERAGTVASDPELWSRCIQVNVIGTYLCTRYAVPHMIKGGGGKIVNIGSGMGHEPGDSNISYRTAKAAVWMFTKSLAVELCRDNIEVNEIIPGPVLTPATEDRFVLGEAPPWNEVERVKLPDEVAELALWLAGRPLGGPTGQSFSLARRPPSG